jgi:oxygen-independent coproporphyrinogen-3 oxidase
MLRHWDRPVPRYTSYPTAPQFYPLNFTEIDRALKTFDVRDKPLSLYLHIPFCRTMCLFCGCSVILNRKPERQAAYVNLLLEEIRLYASRFTQKRRVAQLHFGGGTPTQLSCSEFDVIMDALHRAFVFDAKAECSIEIDPRTVYFDEGKKLRYLHQLGLNRVSFGVQDLDPEVQRAVKRHQTEEMTVMAYELARDIGFLGINLDLIYGLPYQTRARFHRTATRIAELKPDRIALFSYAKVPWLKAHQKAIDEQAEPSVEEKFAIYQDARETFLNAGYVGIGMDHFALDGDSLSRAYRDQTLFRNFQGYSLQLADDMLGFGITSIGMISDTFVQNVKTLDEYAMEIQAGRIPIVRGFVLSEEDRRRRYVIQTLMCRFMLDKREFQRLYGREFDVEFASAQAALVSLKEEGLLEETAEALLPTTQGRLFIRLIAAAFDAYLKPEQHRYSRSV